jgi:hypothetical protein
MFKLDSGATMSSNDNVYWKMERTGKVAVVAYFTVQLQHSPEENEGDHKKSLVITYYAPAKIKNQVQ